MKRFTYQYKDVANAEISATPKWGNIIWDAGNQYSYGYGFNSVFELNPFLEDAIIPEISYSENNASYSEKTVKAWTFYCDSYEADIDTNGWATSDENYNKGNGSEENPWRNLDYAIRRIAECRKCLRNETYDRGALCCPDKFYFQIKVKGEINYKIGYPSWQQSDKNEYPNIIITPWNQQQIEISSPNILFIGGLIFIKCKFINTTFHSENNAMTFYNSDFEYSLSDFYYGYFISFGKLKIIKCNINNSNSTGALCYNSTGQNAQDGIQVIDCHCDNIVPGYSSVVTVYNSEFKIDEWWARDYYPPICGRSKLYNVYFYFKDENTYRTGHIYSASDCIFYNVHLYIDARLRDGNQSISGFSSCYRNIFQNCHVYFTLPELHCWTPQYTSLLRGYIDAVGFIDNTDSIYYDCSAQNTCLKCADETYTCRTPDF